MDTSIYQDVAGIGIGDGVEAIWGCTYENITTIWYQMSVVQSGTFELFINPDEYPSIESFVDYNIALLDMTGLTCDDILSAPQLVCLSGYNHYGDYILNDWTGVVDSLDVIDTTNVFAPTVTLDSGHVYYLQLTNTLTDETNFQMITNGTAGFASPEPLMDIASVDSCSNMQSVSIHISVPIRCKYLKSDGSQFQLSGIDAPNCVSAYWSDCVDGFAQNIILSFDEPITHQENLWLQYSDSLPLRNECGRNLRDTSIAITGDYYFMNFKSSDTIICSGEQFTLHNMSQNLDSVAFQYESGSSWATDTLHIFHTIGMHTIQVFAKHCDSIFTTQFTVLVKAQPTNFNLPDDTTICGGGLVMLDVKQPATVTCTWYDHTTGNTWSGEIQNNTWINFELSNEECNQKDSIKIITECGLYFPNAFTPNDDQFNDYWQPVNFAATIKKTIIYNRWGEKIFEDNSTTPKWTGADQMLGTYIFVCTYQDDNGMHTASGNIILLR